MKTRVIAYLRVSTTEQAEHGVSLAAQRAKLEAYAIALDLHLVDVIADPGQSAKSLDRPGLQAALAALEAGTASALLVCKLDRLTRSVRDLGELIERYFAGDRFNLMSVADHIDTSSASGRLMLNLLVSVSQWERETTGERTSAALRHLQTQGVHVGRAGYGVAHTATRDDSGRAVLATVQAETEVLARMMTLRERGLSYQTIADTLNADGTPTKRGGQWHSRTVGRILSR